MNISNKIQYYFDSEYQSRKNFIRQELIGGLSTFLATNYILFVNPEILSNTGMDKGALFTTTCIVTIVSTFIMGLFAKWPVTLAPGMGTNAFFTFSIVLGLKIPWQEALAAVFVAGLLMVISTVSNLRKFIIDSLPESLKSGFGLGVGAFILFLGLKISGLIVSNPNTLLTLGNLFSTQSILVCLGFLLLLCLEYFNVIGSVILSILFISLANLFLGGQNLFHGFIGTPPSISPILGKLDFSHILSLDFLNIVLIIFIMDFFDSTGVITGVMNNISKHVQRPPKMKHALTVDGLSSCLGAFMGTSTVTSYTESIIGVKAGARTGLASIFTALFFLLALFFSPLLSFIPAFATTPALIYIGFSILSDISNIQFKTKIDAFTCIIAIITMPLTFSIVNGVMFSTFVWSFLHFISGSFFHKEFTKKYFMIPIISILLILAEYYHSIIPR